MRARKAIASLSVAGLAALGIVVTAPTAYAGDYGCAGNYSWSGPVYDGAGENAGTVYDYWDGTNNCSVFVKGFFSGTPTGTRIEIYNNAGQEGTPDAGDYSYYAGPVTVNGVGHCIEEHIMASDNWGYLYVNYWTPWHSGTNC